MVWTRELSPQMAHSVYSGADELARRNPGDALAAQYATAAANMPWRGYTHVACQENFQSTTQSLSTCKQSCINRRGCEKGFSHRSSNSNCRIPTLTASGVNDCTAKSLPGHTYYVYMGAHPRADWRLNLDGKWDNQNVNEDTTEGTGLCVDCSMTPAVHWKRHNVQSTRYETADNSQNSGRTNALKLTGWDTLDLSLAESMSTVESTVAAWVKTETSTPDWADWWGGNAYALRLEMRPTGTAQIWADDGSRGRASSDSIPTVRDGHWHYLAVIYGSSQVQLFVDGLVRLTASALTATTYTAFRIGRSYDANSVGVRASFNDVQLWRSELSPEQLNRNMHGHHSEFSSVSHSSRLVNFNSQYQVDVSAGSMVPTEESLELQVCIVVPRVVPSVLVWCPVWCIVCGGGA